MILDDILTLARHHGVPDDATCSPTRSKACAVLERIETLLFIDYAWKDRPPLGERLRVVIEKGLA
jgi:hypothetical protein